MAGFILLMRFVKKLFSMTERQTYAGSWLPNYEFGKTGFESGNYVIEPDHFLNKITPRAISVAPATIIPQSIIWIPPGVSR